MKAFFLTLLAFLIVSCSGEGKKKRGVDYAKFKSEVTLTPEQEKYLEDFTAHSDDAFQLQTAPPEE